MKTKKRKSSNPPRYCNGCNFILMENEHNKDSQDNEYCDECKIEVEAIAGDNSCLISKTNKVNKK